MGYGALMVVVNNTDQPRQLRITDIDEMHNNGEEGSNLEVWNNVVLEGRSAIPSTGMQYIEAEASLWASKFTLHVGEEALAFEDDAEAFYVKNGYDDIDVFITNRVTLKDISNMGLIAVVVKDTAPNTWMANLNAKTNGAFFEKQVANVCFPASHDAGMYTLTRQTFGSTDCNTRTQRLNIGDQLQAGVRYFDMRPAVWEPTGPMCLGHFTDTEDGYGSLGQDLTSALEQARDFCDAHPQEIIILKFSHYSCQSDDPFDDTLKAKMLNDYIHPLLGNHMFTSSDANLNLGAQTLRSIVESGQRIICVFDDLNTFIDPNVGVFSFGGPADTSKNFRLFDSYTGTDSYRKMVDDQVAKWGGFTPSDWSMFLLSFTLTNTPVIGSCILDMADAANPSLLPILAKDYPAIKRMPNFLYVDGVDYATPVQAAIYCNNMQL